MNVPPGATGPWPDPSTGPPADPSALPGTWRRSLLHWYGESESDTTTSVTWLQGSSWYVDIRQPEDRPDWGAVRCAGDLTGEQARWLRAQEGFAGRLVIDDAAAGRVCWERAIDWMPAPGVTDTGTLHDEDGTLVERGSHLPYLEHWHREADAPVGQLGHLVAQHVSTNATAVLIRAGQRFGFARGRPSTAVDDVVDLVGCEVSLGVIRADRWLITTSTLPWCEQTTMTWSSRIDDQWSVIETENAKLLDQLVVS